MDDDVKKSIEKFAAIEIVVQEQQKEIDILKKQIDYLTSSKSNMIGSNIMYL